MTALDKLDDLWSLFYGMFVDQTLLSILFEQCPKLVASAESAETWRAGPYGHFLTPCDAGTLAELRCMWVAYLDTTALSSKRANRFEWRVAEGIQGVGQHMGAEGTTTAARSADPSRQFDGYWSSGATDDGAQGQGQHRRLSVIPTYAFSIDGDKFAVHFPSPGSIS